jgi:hypothetical protein
MYMIFWILQRTIISLILILCCHYIYIFLKNNLTIPKTRDLVNSPRDKYKEMYSKINEDISVKNMNSKNENVTDKSQTKMKDELKNYLRDLKNSGSNGTPANLQDNVNASNELDSFSKNDFTAY